MKLKVPDGARPVANFDDWTLYALPVRPADSILWRKFKLMLPLDVRAKRGARRACKFGWNVDALRFAKDRFIVELQHAHPDLFARLETHMSLSYAAADLGLTDAAIAAERKRLKAARTERRAS